jgi:hypothetical protein
MPKNRVAFLELEPEGMKAEELWHLTGFVRCTDCGYLVHTQTLTALPEHRCAERQARPRRTQRVTRSTQLTLPVTRSTRSTLPVRERRQTDVIRDLSDYDRDRGTEGDG